jgi:hypothetical protein
MFTERPSAVRSRADAATGVSDAKRDDAGRLRAPMLAMGAWPERRG